ncbi:MAG: universal stress protein [Desulfobacteraceae bacterium]|nr:MAG: universal stress protein [Desulfobacteraceae bacterium]
MRIAPQKIMCAIDFSEFTHLILSYGKSLAQEYGAALTLCHVIPEAPIVSSHMTPYIVYAGIESERVALARERLDSMAREIDFKCEIAIATGHPADEIDRLARENDADMVIAATYGGSGFKRFLIGSVTSRLVKILSSPLLVLQAKETLPKEPVLEKLKLEKILVGCDFSSDSTLAFDYALSLAQEFQTQLHLAHVMRPAMPVDLSESDYAQLQSRDAEMVPEPGDSLTSHLKRQLSEMVPEDSRNWCTPVTVLLQGQPYQELLDYAARESVDMIVLGIRGHSLLEQFLVGSTTDRVISRAPCPVLAVRHNH